VTATGDSVTLDLPITRAVTADLDKLNAAQGAIDATNKELSAQTGLTADANAKLTDANNIIANDKVLATDQTKACAAQVADVKAKARKSKFKWFIAGYI